MSEMLDSTTQFRKNGFNDEDSAQLAQVAATFQNVADDAVSAGDAASLCQLCRIFIVEAVLPKLGRRVQHF